MSNTPKAYSYIRFSSPQQAKGDSLRRQLEQTKKYCEQNNLELDQSLTMYDLGLSAYHGHHRTQGTLGQFIKLVEQGKIEKGTVLIVENLDRLSRQEILTALNQFTSIIQAGITLVTLQDGMKYSQESIKDNWSQLIISITYMARAHEESRTKSKRIAAKWEERRKKAVIENKKMFPTSPAWMYLSEDKTEFKLIPEAAKAIRRIYQMKLSGLGYPSIVRQLNQEEDTWKPPKWKRRPRGGWTVNYVVKIIKDEDRQLIGELPLYTREEVKNEETEETKIVRVPTGDILKNYYPKVFKTKDDLILYHRVRDLSKQNSKKKGRGGGRIGEAKNVFKDIVKCGVCGSTMRFIHGTGHRQSYLHCMSSKYNEKVDLPVKRTSREISMSVGRRLNSDKKLPFHKKEYYEGVCSARSINYTDFENLFLADFDDVEVKQLLPDQDETETEISYTRNSIKAHESELEDTEKQIAIGVKNIFTIEDDEILKSANKHLSELRIKKQSLEETIDSEEGKLKRLQSDAKRLREGINHAKEINELRAKAKTAEELKEINLRLRMQIQQLCDRIEIYPTAKGSDFIPVQQLKGDVVKIMRSKTVAKIRIRYKDAARPRDLINVNYTLEP